MAGGDMLTGHTRLPNQIKMQLGFVAVERIELSRFTAPGLKPDVSTNFTTRQYM